MSGPTYAASSTTVNGHTTGTFTFLGRQDAHTLEAARRITGMDIRRGQYKLGEPIPFNYTEESTR